MRFYSLSELRSKLKLMNLSELSGVIGLHRQTLYKFMSAKGSSINFETYRKLVEYFEGQTNA